MKRNDILYGFQFVGHLVGNVWVGDKKDPCKKLWIIFKARAWHSWFQNYFHFQTPFYTKKNPIKRPHLHPKLLTKPVLKTDYTRNFSLTWRNVTSFLRIASHSNCHNVSEDIKHTLRNRISPVSNQSFLPIVLESFFKKKIIIVFGKDWKIMRLDLTFSK